MTTGDVGDDHAFSLLKRVKLRFKTAPTSATFQHYWKNESGDSLTAGTLATMSGNKFDCLSSARWHRGLISFTGDVEVTGMGAVHSASSAE